MMFLGEIASATRMKLVLSLLIGTTLSGLAESLALADKLGLSTEDVLKVRVCWRSYGTLNNFVSQSSMSICGHIETNNSNDKYTDLLKLWMSINNAAG